MHDRALLIPAASLGVASALAGATPLAPAFEAWPPIEPALVIADGFQQTGWAESQRRNDASEPTQRQEFSYHGHARLESVRRESWFMDKWQTSQVEMMTCDDTGRFSEKLRQEAVGITPQNRGRFTCDHSARPRVRDGPNNREIEVEFSEEVTNESALRCEAYRFVENQTAVTDGTTAASAMVHTVAAHLANPRLQGGRLTLRATGFTDFAVTASEAVP